MIILWKERLAFLAVPKTGTHAVEEVLRPHAQILFQGPPNVRHINVRSFGRFIRPYLDFAGGNGIETFAVMREPREWLQSWYRYRARDELLGKPNSTAGLSFAEFVEAYISTDPPPFAQVGSQARFVTGRDGSIGIDHLFRYDRMGQLTDFLSDRLGLPVDLPTRNVSPRNVVSYDLPADIAAALDRHLADDDRIFATLASD